MASIAVAQEDVQPLIDRDDPPPSAAPGENPEDIPPPRPVPTQPQSVVSTDDPTALAPNTFRRATPDASGEIHAYDFGVSVLPVDSGLRVQGVIVGSPAQAAGVRPNDIILEVNGQEVGNGDLLMQKVESVSVSRAGDARTLTVDDTYETARDELSRRLRNSSSAVPAPQPATDSSAVRRSYSVPRTTYSAPQSYRYAPRYNSPSTYSRYYRSSPYSYRSGYGATYYRSRPSVSIGIGVGTGGFYGPGRGFYGPGRGRGFYGPGFGPAFYGRGRSGVGISIGGIGIRF